ncbi:MAG: hypothetical protein GY754_02265 [bacterium]|nr:hypothetical protein [bacterium]
MYQKKIIHENGVKKFRGGELHYQEGMPLVTLHGTYYEMGLQYGVLLKDEIQEFFAINNRCKNEVIAKIPWYFRPFAGIAEKIIAWYNSKRIPRKYRSEIKGLSRGSGVPYNDVAFVAFGGVVFDAGCTALLSRSEKPGGSLLHGQNLDFEPYYLGNFPVIMEYNPQGKFRYVNFGIRGVPGMFHGINKNGISITVNYGDGAYNRKNNGLPMGYKIREVLEGAAALKDADAILRSHETDEPGWIVTIGSAFEKTGAVYDIFDNIIERSDLNEKENMYALNRIFSKDRHPDMKNSKKYLPISRGEGTYNLVRAETMEKLLRRKKIENIDDMISCLGNMDLSGYSDCVGSLNATIVNERTQHTLIFDAANYSVYFASAPGYSALSTIYQYDIKTSRVSVYKQENPKRGAGDIKRFLHWYGEYQEVLLVNRILAGVQNKFRFIKLPPGGFERILKQSDLSLDLNPRELWSFYLIWKQDRNAINNTQLISAIDKTISRYSDYAILYIMKGNILRKSREPSSAIPCYEQALQAKILSGYDRIHIYRDLVYLYEKSGNKTKAAERSKQCLDLVEDLQREYCAGKKVEEIYRDIRKYVRKR